MSLEDELFVKVKPDIERATEIARFNERMMYNMELDRAKSAIEQHRETEEDMRQYITSLQHELGDTKQRLRQVDMGRQEAVDLARNILLGVLFFCFVLMVLMVLARVFGVM